MPNETNIKPRMVEGWQQGDFYIFPNQKQIIVARERPKPPFTSIEESDMFNAMQSLSGSAFKLYMYMCSNKDGFQFALSPTAVKRKTGVSRNSYDRAVKSMLDAGYLIPWSEYLPCDKCNRICNDHSTCDHIYLFSPKSKNEMGDVHESLSKRSKTWESPIMNPSTDSTETSSEDSWRTDKFDRYGKE